MYTNMYTYIYIHVRNLHQDPYIYGNSVQVSHKVRICTHWNKLKQTLTRTHAHKQKKERGKVRARTQKRGKPGIHSNAEIQDASACYEHFWIITCCIFPKLHCHLTVLFMIVHICVYACVCVCVCVCVCACLQVCVCTHLCSYARRGYLKKKNDTHQQLQGLSSPSRCTLWPIPA